MAHRDLTDVRIRARKRYVEDGVTSFSQIALEEGTTRQTVGKWAKDEAWLSQREAATTASPNLTKRMTRILSNLMSEIEQKQSDGLPVSDMLAKRMMSYSKSIRELEQEYDKRGVVIEMVKRLIAYIAPMQNEKRLLQDLKRIMPGFLASIE